MSKQRSEEWQENDFGSHPWHWISGEREYIDAEGLNAKEDELRIARIALHAIADWTTPRDPGDYQNLASEALLKMKELWS